VHRIFSAIAPRYDFLNTALSFKQDKYWRRFTVEKTGLLPGGHGLDVCCGTGMLAIEQAKMVGPAGKVVGLDFCAAMLVKAKENITRTPYQNNIELTQGNALNLPFAKACFDSATIGFALRNVPDLRQTILEMKRVVRPGGKVVSLELSRPNKVGFKQAYFFYFNFLVPVLGYLVSGVKGPYSYLPASLKNFPPQKEISNIFRSVGLTGVTYYELTGGIVTVHVGTVPSRTSDVSSRTSGEKHTKSDVGR